MNDLELKIECLRLALHGTYTTVEELLVNAKAIYDFVKA